MRYPLRDSRVYRSATFLVSCVASLLLVGTARGGDRIDADFQVQLSSIISQRAIPISAIGISAPDTVTASEGELVSITATAGSGTGLQLITLSVTGAPPALVISANTSPNYNPMMTLSGTLGLSSAGTWIIHWHAEDNYDQVDSTTTQLIVTDSNRAPSANPGGPYSGAVNVPVSFNGGGSSDLDGDLLTFLWDYGDGVTGVGDSPTHVYASGGTYDVCLVVTDNGSPPRSSTQVCTTASITSLLPADAFTVGGDKRIEISADKSGWCVYLQPRDGGFGVTDIIPATIVSKFNGRTISVTGARKENVAGDKNGDGIADIRCCFSATDLRVLFAGLPPGRTTAQDTLEGDLVNGSKFRAVLSIDVVNRDKSPEATVAPNPMNPRATLTFSVRSAGAVTVRLYDFGGRIVRTVVESASYRSGIHTLLLDGLDDRGHLLASGVYFYRVETPDGPMEGRFVVAR